MLKRTNEGYYFISKRGIRYELYEGVTIGGDKTCTSDAIIIMLSEVRDDVDNMLVNFIMGANFFEDELDVFEKDIAYMVDEYEKRNNLKGEIETW